MLNKTMRHELPRRFQSRRDGAGIYTVPSNNKLLGALDRKVEKREAQDEEIEGGWKEVIRKPSANEESEEKELADTSDEDGGG